MTSAINVVVHMQLFWCSSKIYYSNIVQLEEYAVCNKVLQAYLIPILPKNLYFFAEGTWSMG